MEVPYSKIGWNFTVSRNITVNENLTVRKSPYFAGLLYVPEQDQNLEKMGLGIVWYFLIEKNWASLAKAYVEIFLIMRFQSLF